MDALLAELGLDPLVPGRLMGYFGLLVSQGVHWPQLVKILRDRHLDTRAISLTAYCFLLVMIAAFLAYGIYLQAWPIIVNNAVGFCVDSAILGIKARNAWHYRRH